MVSVAGASAAAGPGACVRRAPLPHRQSIAQVAASTVRVRPSTVTVSRPVALGILVAPGRSAVHTCVPPEVLTTSWGCPSTSSSRAKFVPTLTRMRLEAQCRRGQFTWSA